MSRSPLPPRTPQPRKKDPFPLWLVAVAIGVIVASGFTLVLRQFADSTSVAATRTAATTRGAAPKNTEFVQFHLAHPIQPDRRFLNAVPVIARLFVVNSPMTQEIPAKPGAVSVKPEDGSWTVFYEDKPIGTLPQIPDFPDYMKFLEEFAKARFPGAQTNPVSPAENSPAEPGENRAYSYKGSFSATRVFSTLAALESEWKKSGHTDVRILQTAARYYADIYLYKTDSLGAFDSFFAHAIGFLAASNALGGARLPMEEALLSNFVGYTVHAKRLARAHPEQDPVKAYILEDRQALEQIAFSKDSSARAKLLAFMSFKSDHLKEKRDYILEQLSENPDALSAFISRLDDGEKLWDGYAIALFMQGLAMSSAESTASKSFGELLLGFMPGGKEPKPLSAGHQDIVRFETAVEAKYPDPPEGGAFSAAAIARDYYRSLFYSGLYDEARHFMFFLASEPASREMLGRLHADSPVAREALLAWWMRTRIAEQYEGKPPGKPEEILPWFRKLGQAPLEGAIERIQEGYVYDDPKVFAQRPYLLAYRDSRPDHLIDLSSAARNVWLDFSAGEYYMRHAVRLVDYRTTLSFHANFAGDRGFYDDFIKNPPDSFRQVRGIVDNLASAGGVPVDVKKRVFLEMIRRYPDSWDLVSIYIKSVAKEGRDDAETLGIVRYWLAKNKDSGQFSILHAARNESALLRRLGRPQEALKAIEPYVQSQQGGVLNEYANVLFALGKIDQAGLAVRATLARYPSATYFKVNLVRYLWHKRQHEDAAKIVITELWERHIDTRKDIARAFVEAFSDDPAGAESAFDAIYATVPQGAAKMNIVLSIDFLNEVRRAGAPAIAFALREKVMKIMPRMNLRWALVPAWEDLEDLYGEARASQWLRENAIPPDLEKVGDMNALCMPAYENRAYDILWNVVTNPDKTRYPQYIEYSWLLRTAAEARKGFSNPERLKILHEHYDGKNPSQMHTALGLYILGKVDESAVLPFARGPENMTIVLYFMAIGEAARGDFSKSATLLNRAIEAPSRPSDIKKTLRERYWALDMLHNWKHKARYPSTIKAEDAAIWREALPPE